LQKLRIEHLLSLPSGICFGGVAEWLGSGLQSRVRRFDSGPRLQSSNTYGRESLIGYEHSGDWRSWLARLHDTQEVTGSIPVSPTIFELRKRAASLRWRFAVLLQVAI
tara:strand:- start:57 stop:380 length:324 start_codon:yes stop_codon:yes gene_type:complete